MDGGEAQAVTPAINADITGLAMSRARYDDPLHVLMKASRFLPRTLSPTACLRQFNRASATQISTASTRSAPFRV